MRTTLLTDIVTADDWSPTPHGGERHGIKHWHERVRQRRHLAHVELRTQRDVRAKPIEKRCETRRWFWDDPLI